MRLSESELQRYARHVALPEIGRAGQEKLKAARVLIIGAGGLGSPAALYLAAAGVGTLGIVDGDRVELSNLQRQILYAENDIGSLKASVARERLQRLNPAVQVVAHAEELVAANARTLFEPYDIVLDGTDRIGTRYITNDACVLLRRPLVTAAIHRFEGQAMTYVPDSGPCYRCLFAEVPDEAIPTCATAGVLGVLPGVMGAIQATEAIKWITGVGELLIGRLLTYDALSMQFHEFRFERRRDCAVCGEDPSITELRDRTALCADQDLDAVRTLSPTELHEQLMSAGEARYMIIDVREPDEFAAGHLEHALNIPLADLPQRLAEIPSSVTATFVCRSGVRSQRACAIAIRAGIASPAHLGGGLDAWTREFGGSAIW
jgi:sulfur-carrier protein adenylyltransferase/sulfurtransferase